MKKQIVSGLFIFAAFIVAPVLAQAQNCVELQKMIDATYNFKPSKLTEAEKDAKSAAMDKVWNAVKANPKELLPCLRKEIDARKNDSFFRFDASNLLVQLDQSAESKKTLIKAYAEADLEDINLLYWLPYIALAGYEGFDTSAAGETWLKYPKSQYYVRGGTLAVNKEKGAVIIYGSMDESIATPVLAKIAAQETHPAREIAVRVLMQQATPDALRKLKKINQKGLSDGTKQSLNVLLTKPVLLKPREGEPKITREKYLDVFQKLVDGKPQEFLRIATADPDGDREVIVVMKQEDIPLIRKVRRAFISQATPHSVEWYDSFTEILMAMIWKPELVK